MLKAIFYALDDEVPWIFEYETDAIMSYLAISSQCHFGKLVKISGIKKVVSDETTFLCSAFILQLRLCFQ